MTHDKPSVEMSIAYLESSAALASLRLDPYWPKWNSPWWHMTVLFEMGQADRIPVRVIQAMVEATNDKYLKYFPIREEEMPAGCDPYRDIICHCALGTIFQILHAAGRDPDLELPWARDWFLRYQLPDGGLNCDEEVYIKPEPRSSVVSTLPALEAILKCTSRPFTEKEERFIDAGAGYLIAHRLVRSARTGQIIDESWLKPCFPRFYHYDVLRGLDWLTTWAESRQKPLPRQSITDGLEAMERNAPNDNVKVERQAYLEEGSLVQASDHSWKWNQNGASTFPLLEEVSAIGSSSPILSETWIRIRERLGVLDRRGHLA